MLSTICDDIIYYQQIKFRRFYSNQEIKLYQYFIEKTEVKPKIVILIDNFVYFFVDNKKYFKAKAKINGIRHQLASKKVLIIRAENTLIRLLFSLFQDLYIHDIKIEMNIYTSKKVITVYFLSYKDRGIAVGRNGDYIKAVNKLFEEFVIFEYNRIPIKIRCEVIKLYN
ncbi:MAG: hypothetical protein ACFFD5_01425 [Candidatus Thorarchaeota archaeon]